MKKVRSFLYLSAALISAGILPSSLTRSAAQTSDTLNQQPQSMLLLEAERIINDDKMRSITAEGNIEARYEDRSLRADKVIYDLDKRRIYAVGNVQITESDGTIRYAEVLNVDETLSSIDADAFATRLENGATVVADSVQRVDGKQSSFERAVYTACETCNDAGEDITPTWAIRAGSAVQNEEDQMIYYRDAVIEIAGMPVLYTPWFAHPDPTSKRRSGLLFPKPGASSKTGVEWEQPYFWALSDTQDLVLAPRLMTSATPMLNYEYRQRFYRGVLNINGSVTHEQFFDGDGDKFGPEDWRSHIIADGRFFINKNWQAGFTAERAGDTLYIDRYDISDTNDIRGIYDPSGKRLTSQLYLLGQSKNYYFESGLASFQSLLAAENNSDIPFFAPNTQYEHYFDAGRFGDVSINASMLYLERESDFDIFRFSGGFGWRNRYIGPLGIVVAPFANARSDFYNIKDNTTSVETSIDRSFAEGGVNISLPLVKNTQNASFIIEPEVMLVHGTSGVNDAAIPVQDGILFEMDQTALFRPNAAPNYDLVETGTRASAGIRASASFDRNVSFEGFFGRHWRDQSDPFFNRLSNLDGTISDYVASAGVDLGSWLQTDVQLRLGQHDFAINRIDASANVAWWRVNMNANYAKISKNILTSPNDQEMLRLQGTVDITKNWFVRFGQIRNIATNHNLSTYLGVGYKDGCSLFSLSYEHKDSVNGVLDDSQSIKFAVSLYTIGAIGDNDFD